MAFINTIVFFSIVQVFFSIASFQACRSSPRAIAEFMKQRTKLIEKSGKLAIGGDLTLNANEQKVNRILMTYKNKEFNDSYKNGKIFPAALHFFKAKPYIEKSCVFKILKKLPKGASLHSHRSAMVSYEYILNNLTYRDHLYAQDHKNGSIDLKFSKNKPGPAWKTVSQIRAEDNTFDARLTKVNTLVVDDPHEAYPDIKTVWTAFENKFTSMKPLLSYKPVFRDFFYQALQELYDDNVRYVEFRGLAKSIYDLDGKKYGSEDVLQIHYETVRDFMKTHPDFWGAKVIISPHRFTTDESISNYLEFLHNMIPKYPNFIVGFDLVGWEDIGNPLTDFLPSLLSIQALTKFFFHAGETNWSGLPPDLNLFDAVLLNTSRIGHGYAAIKHPEILKMTKEKGIALEISPISNQVLMLVQDLRNHPATFLIANNYPVVITPDDPGLWGAEALSYDWYYAFMAMSDRHTDLRLLKQLALNSIRYSGMEYGLKNRAYEKFKKSWNAFLNVIIKGGFDKCTYD